MFRKFLGVFQHRLIDAKCCAVPDAESEMAL